MDLVEVSKRKETPSKRHPWELARLEVVNELLSGVIKNEDAFTILDIGCGDIFFISELSKKYPLVQFYAIDIAFTDDLIKTLQTKANKNIRLFKTLDEASAYLNQPADIVLLLDVIEHIEHDKDFLKNLHAHKNIGEATHMMITVPAFQSLFCSHDHFLGHYRRYTNQNLKTTIEACGFKKIKLGYFFSSLILPRIFQVLKEKIMPPSKEESTTGLVEWNKGAGITSFIKNILIIDFKIYKFISSLTGIKLPGLSNYIICKKQ